DEDEGGNGHAEGEAEVAKGGPEEGVDHGQLRAREVDLGEAGAEGRARYGAFAFDELGCIGISFERGESGLYVFGRVVVLFALVLGGFVVSEELGEGDDVGVERSGRVVAFVDVELEGVG